MTFISQWRGLRRAATRLVRSVFVLLNLLMLSTATRAQAQTAAAASSSAQPSVTTRALSLAEALKAAESTSEQVEIARAGLMRAKGQQFQARSALLPQLSSTLNYQKTLQNQFSALSKKSSSGKSGGSGGSDSSLSNNPLTKIFASPYTTTFGVTAQQSLYSGGRNRANVRAAEAARTSAEIGLTSVQAQVQLDVTEAYYDALLADRLLAIAESSLVQTERTLRQVQLSKQVGATSEFELIRARVTRDNQRPQFLQTRTARDLSYLHLKQLLDLPLEQALALTDAIGDEASAVAVAAVAPASQVPTSLTVVPSEVTAVDPRVRAAVDRVLATSDTGAPSRAPVRQAAAALDAAKQQLKASRASRVPSLGVSTNYQRIAYPSGGVPRSLGDFYPNWTLGVGVSFPFFTGGRVHGEMMAAQAGVIEAEQRLQLSREGATLDARQSVAQLEEAEESWTASMGTAEQAARAYAIAEVRYREGISTQIELSESRVQLQQAQANRARAARDLRVAQKRLELLRDLPFSSGGGTGSATQQSSPSVQTQGAGRSGASNQSGGNTP